MADQSRTHKQEIANGVIVSVLDVPKVPDKCNSSTRIVSTKDEVQGDMKPPYVAMFAAELIGTALLMFLGCMGCIRSYTNEDRATYHFGGLTFGLTVMLIIQTFGHVSGAHLNPAVTVATVIFRIVKPVMAVVYIVAQFIGAILGYGLLKVLVTDKHAPTGFCATTVSDDLSSVQGLGVEIVITTVLILICCAVWDKRNVANSDSVPLRFGLAIAAISMAAGPLTGASMNTARSFAPLVYGGSWTHHWIYWLGPNVAALIACGLYKLLFSVNESETDSRQESIYLNEQPQVEKV